MTPPKAANPTTFTEPFLQTAEDWPDWENALLHKAGKLHRYVLAKELGVKEVVAPEPAHYNLTAEAKGWVLKAGRELQAFDDGDEFFMDVVIAEDGSRQMVEKPHHPRNEILDDLFVSLDDLTPRGRAAYETDLATFEARYTIWKDFEKADTALRNWMLDSVCPNYPRVAFRHGWPTPAWYAKLEEVVDYQGPSQKALRRQALKELRLFPISPSARTATIFASDNSLISTCTLGFIGQAVVAILQREKDTANKYLSVFQFTVTTNQLLKLFAAELRSTKEEFAVTHVKSADLEKDGQEKLAKGNYMGGINILIA
ncbi:hypothetical protein N0V85_009237 [Neurospora sp. IMI 360204]|nr:hypothetical protein N0V85_009237 [Neurospora sp. IMI 360204]